MNVSIAEVVGISVNEDGSLNDFGKNLIAALAPHLGLIHKSRWGPAFVPLTRLLVRVNVDLAIVDNGEVLLDYRRDEYFRGWHFPGGCLGPGESLVEAASRIAQSDFGLPITVEKELRTFNNPENHRSHDASFFLLCRIDPKTRSLLSKPGHKWFKECPQDMIDVHFKNWEEVKKYLE